MTARKLKAAIADSIKLSHPENGSPAKLTGVFFYSSPLSNTSDAVSELCIYEKMVSCCITCTVITGLGHLDYPGHLGYFFLGSSGSDPDLLLSKLDPKYLTITYINP